MAAFFKLPIVNTNTTSWGPSSTDTDANDEASSRFAHLPYAPFGRSDRLGRCADFTTQSFARTGDATAGYFRNARSRNNQESNKNLEFQYKVDAEVSIIMYCYCNYFISFIFTLKMLTSYAYTLYCINTHNNNRRKRNFNWLIQVKYRVEQVVLPAVNALFLKLNVVQMLPVCVN